jgi:diguanylate cyclase (GGDEF)-like protein
VPPAQSRWWRLGFPPEVEARFEAETGDRRSRSLIAGGLLSLAVFDLFLIVDLIERPEVMRVAIFWRLGVVTTYGLVVLAAVRRGLPPAWREAALGSASVVSMVAACNIYRATTSGVGVYDPFMFGLIFLAGNVVLQARFFVGLACSGISLLVATASLFGPGALPGPGRVFAMGLLTATLVLTAQVCYRQERAERAAYLVILRESVRRAVAIAAADRYAALSEMDALTSVPNRRAFDQTLQQSWETAAERGQELVAILVDIDHFKRFNDRFGHPAGDGCLRAVAQAMRAALRDRDFLARIGGEEFAVLVHPATRETGVEVAERLRRAVERAAIPHDGLDGQEVVTISVGGAAGSPADVESPAVLVEAADVALYEAKHRGRNRCVVADVTPRAADTRRQAR